MTTMVTQYVSTDREYIHISTIRSKDQRPLGSFSLESGRDTFQPGTCVHIIDRPVGDHPKLTILHSALTFSYTYDASAGAGVDIYIVGMSDPAFLVLGLYLQAA